LHLILRAFVQVGYAMIEAYNAALLFVPTVGARIQRERLRYACRPSLISFPALQPEL
jgi:hypothetical protein